MRRIGRIALFVLAVLALIVVVLNWTYGRLPGEPKPHGSFVTVDGLRIHYLERAGTGTPVVLIHGLPGTAEDFNKVTPLLAGHRTIAFDRPGFGYSGHGYLKFDRQIATLDSLLRALRVTRPVLVGHSYGGTLALAFAERHPNQVRGLVLVDAAAAGQHLGSYDELQAHLVKALQLPVIHQLANATFAQLLTTASVKQGDDQAFHPHAVDSAHERRLLEINSTRGNLEAFAGEQLAANGVIDGVDKRLATIALPAVVIQGANDQLVEPVHGRRLAATLPHARLEIVSGGHMAPYTHPYAVAAAVGSVE
ncbi:MAG TPA: alpha/beta hydrolase [Solirubrobacteraceae bacterium]|nr:alpha/beta hydrolase [Solirubrobacteraceae bacterium]